MAEALAIRTDMRGFQEMVRARIVCPGDAVLYCWGRQTPLAWAIERVQRRALADLGQGTDRTQGKQGTDVGGGAGSRELGTRNSELVRQCAAYTHAGMVVDAELTAEMTAPRARLIAWARRLRVGDRVLIVRPQRASAKQMQFAAEDLIQLASHRTQYPWRELLTYWFGTLPAAIAAPHFAEHFLDHRRDVCSGAIWKSWWDEGAVEADGGDSLPESWYPGRMAIDTKYLQRIAEVTIVKEGQGDADED